MKAPAGFRAAPGEVLGYAGADAPRYPEKRQTNAGAKLPAYPEWEIIWRSMEEKVINSAEQKQDKQEKLKGYYAASLSALEQNMLIAAGEIEGLDEEIALIRARLSIWIKEHPEDMDTLLKSVDVLAKILATRYRLSKKARENLAESITSVLREIGGALFPEGVNHGV